MGVHIDMFNHYTCLGMLGDAGGIKKSILGRPLLLPEHPAHPPDCLVEHRKFRWLPPEHPVRTARPAIRRIIRWLPPEHPVWPLLVLPRTGDPGFCTSTHFGSIQPRSSPKWDRQGQNVGSGSN